ncbi:MAG: ParB/RepB/Spo0J family partition protein [Planctomycetota bacterium]|nr:ParB/RepB/Spo0J family partition protein [Planctomycetota bacterium]
MANGNKNGMKKRLGRGLNALLGDPESTANAPAGDTPAGEDRNAAAPAPKQTVAVDLIDPNPFQPRKEFSPESLAELSESIKRHGVLQPILLRPINGRFQLIAGERRWRAAKEAGLGEVPARLLELDDRQVCEAAIEENLKRQDLSVLEKAQAFQEYLDRFECSIEDLSKQLSMSRSNVSNMLRLLELPNAVKELLSRDAISPGHARALLPLDEAQQLELCARIQKESWSVRQTEAEVRAVQNDGSTKPTKPAAEKPPVPEASNHVLSLQNFLRDQLGQRVEIKLSAKNAGRLIVHFGSNTEFEQLVRKLKNAA